MPEIAFFVIYPMMAFVAALVVVAVLGLAFHGERLWTESLVPTIAPLMLLGIALSTVLSGRNLAYAEKHIDRLASQPDGGQNVLQVLTLLILSVAVAKIIGSLIRPAPAVGAPGKSLFFALVLYIFGSNFFPSLFGKVPAFVHSMAYPLFVLTAIWTARNESLESAINAAKFALFSLMFGSLVVAVVEPSIALQPDYKGLIPGLNVRLWGLGSNPNSLGPLALLAVLLDYMQPTRKRWLRGLLWLVCGSVIVLAQSKTAWLALLVASMILSWYRWGHINRHKTTQYLILLFIAIGIFACIGLLYFDLPGIWAQFLATREGDSLTSLTGRTAIWNVAIKTWLTSPLFGYGPLAWDSQFRTNIGMAFAFNAHNQFLHTLSVSGAIGFVTLLVYLGYLIASAFQTAAVTRGVSVTILAMMLFRSTSEVPLVLNGLFDSEVLTHVILFAILTRQVHVRRKESCPCPRN
jgi:O-antigen ligase